MIRVTTNSTLRNYKSSLLRASGNVDSAINKVLTQRNFTSYAEDPAAASQAFRIRRAFARNSDYLTNTNSLISKFEAANSAAGTVKKAVAVNIIAIILLSLPCVLGFNVWSGFMPLGAGSNIQDLEDFIVSNNLLPIGSLIYLLFCTSRYGWGYDKFLEEANAGTGLKFPKGVKFYVSYILPLIILGIFIQGYWVKFVK